MKINTAGLKTSTILENIRDALVFVDLEGTIRYTNKAFQEMVGESSKQLYAKRLSDVFPQEIYKSVDPQNVSQNAQTHFNLAIPDQSGVSRSYCFSVSRVRNREGSITGFLENFRDMDKLGSMILQLEEVNQAIQREKDRTERIADSIADGIFTVDRELNILSFSGKMEQLTGIAAADAIGRKCWEVLRGTKCNTDCPLRWSFEHVATVERCSEVFSISQKSQIPVFITTAFLQDEAGKLIAVVHDRSEIERLRDELHEHYSYENIIGRTKVMCEMFQMIEAVSETDATVLIEGETGTGKEMVAKAIHHRSPRRDGPFIMLNCAALNDNLLESELFGHVRGAFTGAIADRPGRFELAAGGTLFLDEIGDTSPALQSKLLRALEEKTIERVGDTRTRKVDVRIMAATNRNLKNLIREGKFREDLYYRLTVMPIRVPPLRERREDIPLLVHYFIDKYRTAYFSGREEQLEGISNRALALLLQYQWPGNVRELEHAIEHAMISTTTNRVERAFLPDSIRELQPADETTEAAEDSSDDSVIKRTLERYHWNTTRAARALGISRTTLWRRMRNLQLASN